MTYIFEDWEDDILSLFFQQAYPREVVEKQFIYANGTGNIKNKIVEALNNGETEIYVFSARQFKYSYRISKFIEAIRR